MNDNTTDEELIVFNRCREEMLNRKVASMSDALRRVRNPVARHRYYRLNASEVSELSRYSEAIREKSAQHPAARSPTSTQEDVMNDTRTAAERVGDAAASEMRRQLEDLTPEDLGYPGMTADELIASERQCWIDEETRIDAQDVGAP